VVDLQELVLVVDLEHLAAKAVVVFQLLVTLEVDLSCSRK
jgi:hypothetical protein